MGRLSVAHCQLGLGAGRLFGAHCQLGLGVGRLMGAHCQLGLGVGQTEMRGLSRADSASGPWK